MNQVRAETAAAGRPEGRILQRRDLVVLFDQIASGAGNTIPLLLVSVRMQVDQIAEYGILMLVATTAIAAQRSIILEPTLATIGRLGSGWIKNRHLLVVAGTTSLLALPVATSVGLAGTSAAIAAIVPAAFAVCIQDSLRYRALSIGAKRSALAADSVWLVAATVALLFVPPIAWQAFVAWSAAGAASTVFLLRPSRGRAIPMRPVLRLGSFQAVDFALASAAALLPFAVAFRGLLNEQVAAYRVAQSILGPVNVIHSALVLSLMLRAGQITSMSRRAVFRQPMMIGAALAAGTAIYMVIGGAVLISIPSNESVRPAILGALVIVTIGATLGAFASPMIGALKALGGQAYAAMARFVTFLSMVACLVTVARDSWPRDPVSISILATSLSGLVVWPMALWWKARRAEPMHDAAETAIDNGEVSA